MPPAENVILNHPDLTPRSLHLIVLPTEACNFRCVYCYENFQLRGMEPWVVRALRRWLEARAPSLDLLELSWFGGEPLLARRTVEEVSAHATELAARHPALRYRAGITTNAYFLSVPLFERLLDLGVTKYQISFDGPRSRHDRKRVLAGGGPTFDRVWANVAAMRGVARPFQVLVRLHVDAENLDSVPEFLDLYEAEFGGDDRFQLFIRELSRLGGPNDDRLRVLEGRDGEAALRALRDEVRRRGLTPFVPEDGAVCYASKGNSFVVRADGRLGKCTVALDHPNNQVGRLREDGTVELSTPRMAAWMRGLWSGDAGELECPMAGLADRPDAAPIAFSLAPSKKSAAPAPSAIAGASNVR